MNSKKDDKQIYNALGMMSGTSMDGIDIALVRTDGKDLLERGKSAAYSYDPAFRKILAASLEPASKLASREEMSGDLAALEQELTKRHADAVERFLDDNAIKRSSIDLIGFHGQTILHRPEKALTIQLGDGKALANETGIPVIFDLRAHDMTEGGQGAPLVPVYHKALAANLPAEFSGRFPVAFVNIGGIGNISWIGIDGTLLAFDTGPGNALIDQWVISNAGIPFDQAGAIASEGFIDQAVVSRYLRAGYFDQPGPKSLDRADFKPLEPGVLSLEDGARTLAHVTAASIVKACDHLPQSPALWIISGGGSHNLTILQDLHELVADHRPADNHPAMVITATEAGFDGDAMEAEAWAYLAVRSFRGLEITWPGTTGVSDASTGGILARPEKMKV